MLNPSERCEGYVDRFQRQLRRLREARGETLQAVGDAIGATKTQIWLLERGKRPNPRLDTLLKLRAHYGVDVSTLIGDHLGTAGSDDWRAALIRQCEHLEPALLKVIFDIAGVSANLKPGAKTRPARDKSAASRRSRR